MYIKSYTKYAVHVFCVIERKSISLILERYEIKTTWKNVTHV